MTWVVDLVHPLLRIKTTQPVSSWAHNWEITRMHDILWHACHICNKLFRTAQLSSKNWALATCLQTLWRKHCLTSNTTNYRQLWFTIRRYYIQHSLRFTDRGSRPQNGSFGRTLGVCHLPGSVEENWAESISSRYRTAVHGTHSVISHLAISICGTVEHSRNSPGLL